MQTNGQDENERLALSQFINLFDPLADLIIYACILDWLPIYMYTHTLIAKASILIIHNFLDNKFAYLVS